MSRHVRAFFMIAGTSLMATGALAQSGADVVEVVVQGGPHAGTYKSTSSETMCGHYTGMKIMFATWRSFETPDGKQMTSAAIKVSNPEKAGAKRGDVLVSFGAEPGKKVVADYNLTDVPVTLTIKGKGAEMSFDGKTKEGIGLRVNAKCSAMETLPN